MDQDWQHDWAAAAEDCAVDAPPSILQAERRIHVRAYNRWASLRSGRAFPSPADLDAAELAEFAPRAVVLRYADPEGMAEPEVTFIGRALREEAGLDAQALPAVQAMPAGSLLQRLASRHREIASHRAPVGVEAEFAGMFGEATLYRGVMLPFSTDGRTIDHVYGVVNWKMAAPGDLPNDIHAAVDAVRSVPMARTERPAPFPAATDEDSRVRLRARPSAAEVAIDALPFEGEFVLLVARREPGGGLSVVAALPAGDAQLARAADQPPLA